MENQVEHFSLPMSQDATVAMSEAGIVARGPILAGEPLDRRLVVRRVKFEDAFTRGTTADRRLLPVGADRRAPNSAPDTPMSQETFEAVMAERELDRPT